jgi:hypothetical protein
MVAFAYGVWDNTASSKALPGIAWCIGVLEERVSYLSDVGIEKVLYDIDRIPCQ